MKKYVMAGLGVMFLCVVSAVHAEMEVKVKDNTANNGFSIKEETTGSTIARFRGDGKVGIGTAVPSNTLEVSKVFTDIFNPSYDTGIVARFSNPSGNVPGRGVGIRLTNLGNGADIGDRTAVLGVVTNSANTYGDFVIKTYNGGASYVDAVTVQNTGNVGIGTTNPTNKIHVQGNNTNWLANIEQQGSGSGLLVKTASTSHVAFDIETGGIDRFTVLASGNVGIGTPNPINPLHVEKSSNGQVVRFKNTATTNSHGLLIETASAASDDFTLDVRPNGVFGSFLVRNDGNVGIGLAFPSYKLDVNGTIRGSNVSPSDMRWKEHIKILDNSLEKMSKLRGVSFEWKDKTKGVGTQVGLIAQEVEKVFPEVVSEDNEGYKSVAYDKLVGVLIEAVKEQQRHIEKQQKQIDELKAAKDIEIVALKAENDALRQEIDSIKTFMSTYAQSVTVPALAQMR